MEYYAIRIYRRAVRRARADGASEEVQLTGLLEDDAGHKEPFHSAEELWQLLVRSVAEGGAPPNDN